MILYLTTGSLVLISLHLVTSIFFEPLRQSSEIWITEFPSKFPTFATSVAVNLVKTPSKFKQVTEKILKANSKLYIEVHPSTLSEFTEILNITQFQVSNIKWKPCIILFWPERKLSPAMVETVSSNLVNGESSSRFALNTEVYVAFEMTKAYASSNASREVYLCDLYNYKQKILLRKRMCRKHYFGKSLIASEGFFAYHPVSVRRRDLNGTTLNIVAQFDPDYVERLQIQEDADGRVEFTGGMCVDILLSMQISMNFKYFPIKGNGWVGILPNGTWTGMAAQMIKEEADLSIAQASMIMMINQLEKISFLHASSTGQFTALFRQPRASSYRDLITSTLTWKSWVAYFITWILVLVAVRALAFFGERMKALSENDAQFAKETIMWAISTSRVIGWYLRPSSLSFRIICLVASYLAYCSYIAFSAELTVNLVTEVLPIRNFGQLSLSTLEVFTDKWLPVARSLIEKIYNRRGVKIPLENSELYSIDVGLANVIFHEPPIAFVTFFDAVSAVFNRMNYSDNFFCHKISSVLIASERTPTGMFVKRGSQLKEVLNYNILMMTESGILSRLNMQYQLRTQKLCPPKQNNYRGGLSIEDTRTPFFIIICGAALCILNLVCEVLLFRKMTVVKNFVVPSSATDAQSI